MIRVLAASVFFLCSAPVMSESFYVGVKPVAADINYEETTGLPLGGSAVVGLGNDRFTLDYEYLTLVSVDIGGTLAAAYVIPDDSPQSTDIRSRALFGSYWIGDTWFARLRAGYRELRIKDAAGEHRTLERNRDPAAGVGAGWRGNHLMLELDYTLLDSDFKYWGLGLNLRF